MMSKEEMNRQWVEKRRQQDVAMTPTEFFRVLSTVEQNLKNGDVTQEQVTKGLQRIADAKNCDSIEELTLKLLHQLRSQ